jgi:hypothetical protein
MDFLPGFAWPVPRAFSSAVAACRFEQGDVLYDAAAAYAPWHGGVPRGVGYWVEVLDPPRSARGVPADAEGNRFEANWSSPVVIEICEPGGVCRKVRCTQGRLFTCLWRDRPDLLAEASTGVESDLPMPKVARDLHKQLEAAVPKLRAALATDSIRLLFVSVLDASSEASRAKARAIEAALATRYAPVSIDLSPVEAAVPEGDGFHPTLRVRGTAVEESDPEAIRGLLKRALYAPTRPSGGSGTDRFKLERHGLLVAGEAESSSGG